ncbi:hypothetical protein HKX48_001771, partial [Thoreauomyces humboldtii]
MREFVKWCPSLNVRSYYGSQAERGNMQRDIMYDLNNVDVIVTTYALATGQKEDRSFLKKLRCRSMILDEG